MRKTVSGANSAKRNAASPLLQQGLAFHRNGQLAEALACYRQCLGKEPRHAEALHMLGVAEFQRGQFDVAADAIERSLRIDPRNPMALFNYGNACRAMGQLDKAMAAFGDALALRPDYREARLNRGLLAFECREWDTCAKDLTIITSQNIDITLLIKLGLACLHLDQFEKAAGVFGHAVEAAPENAEAFCHLGSSLMKLDRFEEAQFCYERSIALTPNYATAHYNLGHLLSQMSNMLGAESSYRRAIASDPDYLDARIQLGILLGWCEQSAAAVEQFDDVLSRQPNHAQAHFNKGLELLANGDLRQGWPEYAWRLEDVDISSGGIVHRIQLPEREWDGVPLAGSLLILPEQGLGDQIFHASMLTDAHKRAPKITCCVDERLVSLFSRSIPGIEFMSTELVQRRLEAGEIEFSAQLHAGSLGQLFRPDMTVLSSAKFPYLVAEPARVNDIRSRLHITSTDKKLVCGIAWHSKNGQTGRQKSLDLAQLAPLLKSLNVQFIDLQYGDTRSERARLEAESGIALTHIDDIDNHNDIDGLAALISACDLVITVSNSTAHLAAALGKPVWIMLAKGPGLFWFWHRQRTDSPWYPTARLFRQSVPGEWAPVVASIAEELGQFAS